MSTDRGNTSHRLGHDRATQLAHFTAERRRRAVPRPGFEPLDPDRLEDGTAAEGSADSDEVADPEEVTDVDGVEGPTDPPPAD